MIDWIVDAFWWLVGAVINVFMFLGLGIMIYRLFKGAKWK